MNFIKENKKEIFKYIAAALIITTGFLLIGPLPTFSELSTYDYIFNNDRFSTIIGLILFISFIAKEFIFILLILIASKVRKLGNLILGIFILFIGIENFMFFLQGGVAPFNAGMSVYMANNFLKSIMNPDQVLTNTSFYFENINFYFYLIVQPIIYFIGIKYIQKLFKLREIKTEIGIIALGLYLVIVSSLEPKQIGYYNRVLNSFVTAISMKVNSYILNIKRNDIYIKDVNKSNQIKNIVFIVAESSRGDYISLNNKTEDSIRSTEFLLKLEENGNLVNYGETYSGANCSSQSNQFLLTGQPLNGKLKYFSTNPTFFQYMKNAGYTTTQIDAPHEGYFNGRYPYDERYIDDYISLTNIEKKDSRDMKGIDILEIKLEENEHNFIYFVQQGVHFPYNNSYPKDSIKFKDYTTNLLKDSNESRMIRNYLNGINHTINNFWIELDKVAQKYPNTLFIYTSDHGVNILPNKEEKNINLTHCLSTFAYFDTLFNVPLFVYSSNKDLLKGLKGSKESAHSTIFPTILKLAGYDIKKIRKLYGNNMEDFDIEKERDRLKFLKLGTNKIYSFPEVKKEIKGYKDNIMQGNKNQFRKKNKI